MELDPDPSTVPPDSAQCPLARCRRGGDWLRGGGRGRVVGVAWPSGRPTCPLHLGHMPAPSPTRAINQCHPIATKVSENEEVPWERIFCFGLLIFNHPQHRGGSRNSLKLKGGGGGGVLGQNSSKWGFRVQVRGNFHILTSNNKKQPLKGGGVKRPNPPPPGSATDPLHAVRKHITH